jgi:prepilin-type processing-associated H-X9-DG protein
VLFHANRETVLFADGHTGKYFSTVDLLKSTTLALCLPAAETLMSCTCEERMLCCTHEKSRLFETQGRLPDKVGDAEIVAMSEAIEREAHTSTLHVPDPSLRREVEPYPHAYTMIHQPIKHRF